MVEFDVVVAADDEDGIGLGGSIPWRLPGDMAYFKSLTTKPSAENVTAPNAVVMGHKTWNSIPDRFRPLPGRRNVVLSRQAELGLPPAVVVASSLEGALERLERERAEQRVGRCFVIGGAQIYEQALGLAQCRHVYLTRVEGHFGCDAFLPPFTAGRVRIACSPTHQEGAMRYRFEQWARTDSVAD